MTTRSRPYTVEELQAGDHTPKPSPSQQQVADPMPSWLSPDQQAHYRLFAKIIDQERELSLVDAQGSPLSLADLRAWVESLDRPEPTPSRAQNMSNVDAILQDLYVGPIIAHLDERARMADKPRQP